jgi:hypothetical protein
VEQQWRSLICRKVTQTLKLNDRSGSSLGQGWLELAPMQQSL